MWIVRHEITSVGGRIDLVPFALNGLLVHRADERPYASKHYEVRYCRYSLDCLAMVAPCVLRAGRTSQMRPLFTVHAGEFLVGAEIERRIRNAAVWVPSKDTGIDLLITRSRTDRPVSLQVKYSRDYSISEPGFVAFGWWTLDTEVVRKSRGSVGLRSSAFRTEARIGDEADRVCDHPTQGSGCTFESNSRAQQARALIFGRYGKDKVLGGARSQDFGEGIDCSRPTRPHFKAA